MHAGVGRQLGWKDDAPVTMPPVHAGPGAGALIVMSARLAPSDLDAILSLQLTVAWAGKGAGSPVAATLRSAE